YLLLGQRLRVDFRIQDAIAGETIASVADTGNQPELLELVSRSGARLREKLGIGELSATQVEGIRAALPSSHQAARFYSEGLSKLRLFDSLGALQLLQDAVARDPTFPLAYSALAEAWSGLGYDEKAKENAKRAFDLST